MPQRPFPTGRTTVNAWECDENDHLNVRFYVARLAEGYGFVADALGVEAGRSLVPQHHHIRFRKELRTGDMTEMRSRVLGVRETGIAMQHELLRAGEVVTTFLSVDAHVDTSNGAPVPWTPEQRAQLDARAQPLRPEEAPRSIDLDGALPAIDLNTARQRQMVEIFRGQVRRSQCDAAGRMLPEFVIGRFSDGVATLWESLGLDRSRMLDRGRGSVVLETRLSYDVLPSDGALLVAHSAMIEVMPRTLRFAHLLFDYRSGIQVAQSEVVVALLDLSARRLAELSDEERHALKAHVKVLTS